MIVKCPRCGELTENQGNPFRPFCCERCKLLDLGNWVSGAYSISGEKSAGDDKSSAMPRKDPDQE